MKKVLVVMALVVMVAALSIAPAAAQGGLDPTAEPNFMTMSVSAGFLPDPFIVNVISGGAVDVSALNLGVGCAGYATTQPDVRLTLSGESQGMRLFFVGDDDTTLIVNTPDGQWLCNDDFSGLDPLVDVATAAEGDYAIWVGSYSSDENVAGYLFVTELLQSEPGNILSTVPGVFGGVSGAGSSNMGGDVNPVADPTFGEVALADGFSPDPYSVELISGGGIDASTLNSACRGMIASAPDYRVDWSASATNLRVFVASEDDTTLVVLGPDGTLYCNDDFSGLQPLVDIGAPAAGEYNIWVGTYGGGTGAATLYVTTQAVDQTSVQ